MKMKPTHEIVTWLTFTLFAFLAVISFSGQVLCVADDDHMQVESDDKSCCDFIGSNSGWIELKDGIGEHPFCGDCDDLDLDQLGTLRVRSRSADIQNVATVTVPVWSDLAISSSKYVGQKTCLYAYSPAINQPQLSISTTIIIC